MRRFAIAAAGGFALSCAAAHAITLEAFEEDAEAAIAAGVAPGLAFAIVDETGVRWAKGFGTANIETGAMVDADTVFTMGSVSKTFIGTAAAIAWADGQLDLDADIGEYLDFAVRNPHAPDAPISFAHLATHTSGILDDEDAYETTYAFDAEAHPTPLSDWLKSYLVPGGDLYDAEANFGPDAPGARYAYSNIGSALAALAVGNAVGQSFAAYCAEQIFAPLGMASTAWFLSEVDRDRFATPYERLPDGGFAPYPDYALATWPDGGLRTSVNDLATYLAAIIGDGRALMDERAHAKLLQRNDLAGVEDLPRRFQFKGLFWGGSSAPSMYDGRIVIGHNGSDPGVLTLMYFDPETRRGAIALANADFDTREDLIALYTLYYQLFDVAL